MNVHRLDTLLDKIDAANSEDPELEFDRGTNKPRALLYSERMRDQLITYAPTASELLTIAASAQHIERWVIPRDSFPTGRVGYLKWRTRLKKYHAERVGDMMSACGYPQEDLVHVGKMLRKEGLRQGGDAQILEDVVCLVFIEHYLEDFSKKHPRAKLIDIIGKTWKKMSAKAHKAALALPLTPDMRQLIEEALSADAR